MIYRDRTFRMVDLGPLIGETNVVSESEFYSCRFLGPNVFGPVRCEFSVCEWFGDPEGMFWQVPPGSLSVQGVIAFVDCRFEGCVFDNVGIAGNASFIANFKATMGLT